MNDIAQGTITAAPTLVRPGASLRVTLDRQVSLGSRLHLLNELGSVVGEVRVDDHDEQDSVVRLIRTTAVVPAITTAFRVASRHR